MTNNINASRLVRALSTGALVVLAMGMKCIPYNQAYSPVPDAGTRVVPPVDPTADSGVNVTGDSGVDVTGDSGVVVEVDAGPTFVPAVACAEPGQARLRVENFAFNIECGCAEATGLICTLPVGTKVTWTFIDSTEHTVAGIAFGSVEVLAGTYDFTFDAAGDYLYECSIHPAMTGYEIHAR